MGPWSEEIQAEDRLRLLAAALEQTRASACVTDADLDPPGPRIVYVNAAYCAMTGRRRDDVIGRSPRLMQGPLTDRSVLDRLRSDLEHGRPFSGETVNYRADGSPFEISWRIDPIVDREGRTTHFVATQQDVTELRRAERLLAAERLIDQTLTAVLRGPSSTVDDVLTVARSVVDAIGVLVPYGHAGIHLTVRTADGPRRITAGAPIDPPLEVDDPHRSPGPDEGLLGHTLSIEGELDGAMAVTGLTSWELEAVDRDGLAELARRVPLVLDAALEYERRRAAALELQRAFLPEVPALDGLEVATRYVPVSFGAEVGGDFYDVTRIDHRVVVTVGDVAGSGLRVAADMGRLALVLRSEIARHGDVPTAMRSADQLCVGDGLFATVTVAIIDPTERTVEIRSAGHPPAIIRRAHHATPVAVPVGPPLGAGRVGWPGVVERFEPGTTLALYTDGLVERRDLDVVDGIDLLTGALADAPVEVEAAADFVVGRLTDARPTADDFAAVLVRSTDD